MKIIVSPAQNIENHIEKPDDIRSFNRLGYVFRGEISSGNEYIFERIVE